MIKKAWLSNAFPRFPFSRFPPMQFCSRVYQSRVVSAPVSSFKARGCLCITVSRYSASPASRYHVRQTVSVNEVTVISSSKLQSVTVEIARLLVSKSWTIQHVLEDYRFLPLAAAAATTTFYYNLFNFSSTS